MIISATAIDTSTIVVHFHCITTATTIINTTTIIQEIPTTTTTIIIIIIDIITLSVARATMRGRWDKRRFFLRRITALQVLGYKAVKFFVLGAGAAVGVGYGLALDD